MITVANTLRMFGNSYLKKASWIIWNLFGPKIAPRTNETNAP
jgi:hypothetical protein